MHKALFELLLAHDISNETKLQLFIETEKYISDAQVLYDLVCYVKNTQTIHLSLPNSLDIVWTWWSLLQRINVSTIASFVLAKLWIPIAKHWSNASTGRVWSFDLLEYLNYQIPQNEEDVMILINHKKPAFLYARLFFPIMKSIAEVRKMYGKPTLFNILWPLLNPANSDFQLIWCALQEKMELMADVIKKMWKKRVCIVRWSDGLDDITLTWESQIIMINESCISKHILTPEMFGISRCSFADIQWWDVAHNAKIALSIFDGTCSTRHLDLVAINCALACFIYYEKIWLDNINASTKLQYYYQKIIDTIRGK